MSALDPARAPRWRPSLLRRRVRERVVATIGLPGHGKTVFLAALFWDSFFTLATAFQDPERPFVARALNTRADEVFYANAKRLHECVLPPANPRSPEPQPALLEFSGIPSPGGRRSALRLRFYDIAGEAFATDDAARTEAPYLAEADDLLFLFDPTRPDFTPLDAARLVDRVYRLVPNGAARNVLLILTKMDVLRVRDEWAGLIGDFWPEQTPTPGSLGAYLREMEALSERFRQWWLLPERRAHALLAGLPPHTRFCGLSALGREPVRTENGRLRLAAPPRPFRVRDPLFWIFRAAGVMR